ncbi:adenine phosphoribosyltransferase [candidate division KSB1 bacterium]|nr:adenine phosphoribosyltransferase [candidate division KSB1 bacterium]
MDLKAIIRDVYDFPKKGIVFKDITTLLMHPKAFDQSIDDLCQPFQDKGIELVVGIEARGFLFGGAMARQLGAGFIPVRKPGKLPADIIKETYSLEYGSDTVEIHADAIRLGQKILVVDDLLATGGTAAAAVKLVEKLGGQIAGVAFLIELDFLNGREKLKDYSIHSLIHFNSE